MGFVGARTSQASGTAKRIAKVSRTTARAVSAAAPLLRVARGSPTGCRNRRPSPGRLHPRRGHRRRPRTNIISSYANPYIRAEPYDVRVQSIDPRGAAEATPQRRANLQWRPARFASLIFEELGHRIIGGALADGDVLPTEPALCEEFGFSRTVVREGLKLLEGRGLFASSRGEGRLFSRGVHGTSSTPMCCASLSSTTGICHCSTT